MCVLGVYFKARLTQHISFHGEERITFNRIITNIDNSDTADYGKFIAPKNGT